MSWAQELFLLRKIKVLYKNKDKVLCVCVWENAHLMHPRLVSNLYYQPKSVPLVYVVLCLCYK